MCSKCDKYAEYLNDNVLPNIDFKKLDESYDADMIYAKGVLNRLHKAMIEVYGSECLGEADGGDEGYVLIPGVLRGINSGKICLALFLLDLSSGAELWETDFLCADGVVSQLDESGAANNTAAYGLYVPYAYCYTADMPSGVHVNKDALPEELKAILKDFRNYPQGGKHD